MHKHDQGYQEGCSWCELDVLLRRLASDVGLSNVESYTQLELTVMRRQNLLRLLAGAD